MSERRSRSKTLEDVKKYQASLTRSVAKKITLDSDEGNSISFTLRVPSMAEFIDAGYRWVNEVVSTVEDSLTDMPEEQRDDYITKRGQATAMRQFGHYISEVELSNDNVINDTETIEKLLDALSSDDNIRTTFRTEVVKYINDTTLSVIGIPVYECSNCGGLNNSDHGIPSMSEVIPLDVIQLFFTLHVRRMQRLKNR
jgi:hypothetical protein